MWRKVVPAVVLLCAFSAIASPSQAQEKPTAPLKIGVSGPFTGGSSPMGLSMLNGIRLAVDEINHIGGIKGRKIALIERDDEAKNEVGAKIAQEFVQQKVVAAIGIVNTGVGLASIDAYQAAKIPLLITVSTGTSLTKKYAPPAAAENYIFRISLTIDLEAKALVAELKRRGLTNVAVMTDTTAYGEAGLKAFEQHSNVAGIALLSKERFNIGDQDMSAQVQRAKESAAQAVVVWGIGPEMAIIAKNREQQGWKAPLMGSWTFSMRNFIDAAGKAGEGALMPQTFIQDAGSTSKNSFLLAYQRAFKIQTIPSPMSAAQGYDGMHLLYLAIIQADSTEGVKIKEAFENLKRRYQGAITNYTKPFSSLDHDAITQNMLLMGKITAGRVDYAYADDQRRSILVRLKNK
ncbi:MAG: ABC transporter substrate-binding protein [Glaciimonas sp.]|nr:ABC transporter substrate-binding protein [Glaciimonas sp.]